MVAARSDLMTFLGKLGIETGTVEHAALFTVAQAQKLRGEIAGGHSKNLFLKDKKGALFLIVAQEDAVIDMKGIHKVIGSGRLSFGKPDLLMEVLGVLPGSVTPFAAINDTANRVGIILDEALMAHERLNFHPLENTATTSIATNDLMVFLRATGHDPKIIAVAAQNGGNEQASAPALQANRSSPHAGRGAAARFLAERSGRGLFDEFRQFHYRRKATARIGRGGPR